MKILLVTEDVPTSHLGGAGRHAVTLGNALIAAGHNVELLGLSAGSVAEESNGFAGKIHRKIGFRRTGWQEHRFGAFLPFRRHHIGLRIATEIRALGFENYDVVHYHGHVVETGLFIPRHVNYVHTLHDQGSECLKFVRFKDNDRCSEVDPAKCALCADSSPNGFQTWLSARAVDIHRNAADTVFKKHKAIFVSEFLRKRFVQNTGSDGNFNARVIHNFISEPATVPPAAQIDSGLPRVLMSGRVDVYKGFVDLLDLVDDGLLNRFEWRVAGDGPLMQRLRERHGHRKLQLLGFLNQSQVIEETRHSTLTLVPSICDEPCATSILEALGYGVRVWTLDRGGSSELLKYQSYDGQMRVFESLDAMTSALHTEELSFTPSRVNRAVSVGERLSEILDYYLLEV